MYYGMQREISPYAMLLERQPLTNGDSTFWYYRTGKTGDCKLTNRMEGAVHPGASGRSDWPRGNSQQWNGWGVQEALGHHYKRPTTMVYESMECLDRKFQSGIKSHTQYSRALQYTTGRTVLEKEGSRAVSRYGLDRNKSYHKDNSASPRQWITKHVSGFCSVGKMAKRIGLRNSEICPRCDEVETAEHVWTCRNSEVDVLWQEKMDELRALLSTQNTPKTIINAITNGLQGWRSGVDHVFNTTTTAGILGNMQNNMGWKHFFEGRMHTAWREHQTNHQRTTGTSNTGRRWVGALVRKLHDIAWDLWEHRNGILHNKETGFAAREADMNVRQLLWKPEIYRIKSIRQIITHDADVICRLGLPQKQQWILRVEAALQHYLRRRESTQYQQEREGMQRYLRQFHRWKKNIIN
jgi:hypothetical protein